MPLVGRRKEGKEGHPLERRCVYCMRAESACNVAGYMQCGGATHACVRACVCAAGHGTQRQPA